MATVYPEVCSELTQCSRRPAGILRTYFLPARCLLNGSSQDYESVRRAWLGKV
jgi:hypothetical protein